MGINLRFICNSLRCFPVFLVITFHKDPRTIISVVVVVVVPAAAADDDDVTTVTTTTMMEDVMAPFCCSEFACVHEIIYSAVIGHLVLRCQKIFLPCTRSIMEEMICILQILEKYENDVVQCMHYL